MACMPRNQPFDQLFALFSEHHFGVLRVHFIGLLLLDLAKSWSLMINTFLAILSVEMDNDFKRNS